MALQDAVIKLRGRVQHDQISAAARAAPESSPGVGAGPRPMPGASGGPGGAAQVFHLPQVSAITGSPPPFFSSCPPLLPSPFRSPLAVCHTDGRPLPSQMAQDHAHHSPPPASRPEVLQPPVPAPSRGPAHHHGPPVGPAPGKILGAPAAWGTFEMPGTGSGRGEAPGRGEAGREAAQGWRMREDEGGAPAPVPSSSPEKTRGGVDAPAAPNLTTLPPAGGGFGRSTILGARSTASTGECSLQRSVGGFRWHWRETSENDLVL